MSDYACQAGKPPPSTQTLHQKGIRKPSSSSSSSSQHHPGNSSILLSDAISPWGRLPLPESSFISIPSPPPLPLSQPPTSIPPSPPPAPQPTPSTLHLVRQNEDEDVSVLNSVGGGRRLQARQRVLPQRRVAHPPRLPPLRPITNLSFSRSFTFSFFELPEHHSPRCRADRIRNLLLLLRQIRY